MRKHLLFIKFVQPLLHAHGRRALEEGRMLLHLPNHLCVTAR